MARGLGEQGEARALCGGGAPGPAP